LKKKKKKTKEPPYLSAQPACRPTSSFPRRPTPSLSRFLFCAFAVDWVPPVSFLPPLPFFFFSTSLARRRSRDSRRLPFLSLAAEEAN
jgi:hypothetical protein